MEKTYTIGSGDRILSETPVDATTGPQNFSRRRILTIVGLTVFVVAILIVYALTCSLFRRLGLATGINRIFYADGLGSAFFVAVTIHMAFATPIIEELFW